MVFKTATLCFVLRRTVCSRSWTTPPSSLSNRHLDQAHRSGWSVVAPGRARGIVAPHELVRLWTQPGIVPWAPDIRNLWIGISIMTISGRQVKAPFVD